MTLRDEMLPIHDVTGLRAIAVLPSGRVVWPIAGGDGTDGASDTDSGAGDGDDGSGSDGDGDTQVDWAKETSKWKALSRKHEADAKKNASAARRLEELEGASKSELEKANEKTAQSEQRAVKAETQLMRIEVAIAKGLSPAMAGRLQGETQEELEADADELMRHLQPATGAGPKPGDTSGGRPREALRSGTAPDTKPEETDPAKLAALVPRY